MALNRKNFLKSILLGGAAVSTCAWNFLKKTEKPIITREFDYCATPTEFSHSDGNRLFYNIGGAGKTLFYSYNLITKEIKNNQEIPLKFCYCYYDKWRKKYYVTTQET